MTPQNSLIVPELLSVKETATLCGISQRQVYRLSDSGHMPRPIKLGRCNRWHKQTLKQWLDASCPDYKTWQPDLGGGK